MAINNGEEKSTVLTALLLFSPLRCSFLRFSIDFPRFLLGAPLDPPRKRATRYFTRPGLARGREEYVLVEEKIRERAGGGSSDRCNALSTVLFFDQME